jgi:hypothetical protein
LTSDNLLGIYPNPFGERLEMKFFSAQSHKLNIQVYDAIGKVVLERTEAINKAAMNTIVLPSLSSIQQGIYFVLIQSEEKQFLRKVIKY